MKVLARFGPVQRALVGSVGTGMVGQAALLVSGVLAARLLGVENRGHLALLLIVPLLLAVFGGLGLALSTTFEIARNPAIARPLLRRHWRFVVGLTFALTVIDGVLLLALFGTEEPTVQMAALISLPALPAVTAQQYGLAVLQGQQRFRAFNLFRLAPSLMYTALVVALFLSTSVTLVHFSASFTGSFVLAGIAALLVAVRGTPKAKTSQRVPTMRELLGFGRKSVLGSISPSDGGGFDQAIIGLFLPRAALGLYVVALAFTNLSRLISQSIGMVAYPNVARRADAADARRTMWRFFIVGLGASAVVVIVLQLSIDRLIPWLFGESFSGAVEVARILLIGVLFSSARRVLGDAARGANQPLAGTVGEISSWIVLIPALAVLTPTFGIQGVAAAIVLSSLTSLLVVLWRLRRPVAGGTRDRRTRTIRLGQLRADGRLAVGLAIVPLTIAAGALPVVASPRVVLLICLAIGWSLVVYLGRGLVVRRARAAGGSGARDDAQAAPPPVVDPRLRVPRALYLLGVVFLGALAIRPLAGVTLSDMFFLAALGWTVMELALRKGGMRFDVPTSLIVGLLLFAIGGVLSSSLSGHPVESVNVVIRLAYITIVWFWLGTVVLETAGHLYLAVVAWVTSIAVSGLVALAQLSVGDVFRVANAVSGRYPGLAEHVNDLGGAAGIVFVPALLVVTMTRSRSLRRWGGLAMLLLVVAGMVLSGSVGGLLAAGMALVVWLSARRVRRRSAALIVPAVACVTAVLALSASATTSSPLERLTGPSTSASATSTLSTRVATVDGAWQRIRENPVVGVGLDLPSRVVEVTSTASQRTQAYQVHNILIGSWYGAGILGLIGIATMLIGVLLVGLRCLLEARTHDESLVALGLCASVVAFVVFAMGAPVLFQRYAWITAGLLLVLRAHQIRRTARERSAGAITSGIAAPAQRPGRQRAALESGVA